MAIFACADASDVKLGGCKMFLTKLWWLRENFMKNFQAFLEQLKGFDKLRADGECSPSHLL